MDCTCSRLKKFGFSYPTIDSVISLTGQCLSAFYGFFADDLPD